MLNALDNVGARRHVNRVCLAANVPLIESGTRGYVGQVRAIIKSRTKCFECDPVAAQKSYPICTIRNHPELPVHCITWAKELLFTKVFLFLRPPHPFLPYVAPHFSHISPFILVF